EIYRIGGEALANAFQHAGASAVETVLEYGRDHFRLLVRDDGQGIDPEVLKAGREGHFGLSGLRERAAKIGARLKVRTAAGTQNYETGRDKAPGPRWHQWSQRPNCTD